MASILTRTRRLASAFSILLFTAALQQASAQGGCTAYAGIISVDEGSVCLHAGQAVLTGTPPADAVVPAGFTTTYILSRTNGLIIEQMGPSPTFQVGSADIWRIHACVHDPATLDLGAIVQFGATSVYDVQALITQGGGPVCASISMTNAAVKTMECEEPCAAFASGMTMDSTLVCLTDGQATLTATPSGTSNVPPGFQVQYLLTRTNGLIIEQLSATPTFTVGSADGWRIHNLVYDPATLDLGTIDLGITSAYDLQSLLLQGGGTICASLDISGAFVKTGACSPNCTAEAGLTSADNPDQCLDEGMAVLSATPDGSSMVPEGYTTAYLLTQGTDGMVILATSGTPEFTVHAAGEYDIHSFVYNASTFDIGALEPGVSTIMGLNAQLMQGGGGICASLDLDGANFQVVDCAPSCLADAGTMGPETEGPCLGGDGALLAAISNGDTLVPPGFVMAYWLSQGSGLILLELGSSPSFTASDTGLYHIHAFVYDPATWDISLVQPGTTTVQELNAMLAQGGGSICASLDFLGAAFTVTACPPSCTAGTDTVITVCLTDPAFQLFPLLGGDPCPGGSWTTPASPVVSGIFDPAVNPAGVYTYTVNDPSGAVQTATVTVNVLECPDEFSADPLQGNDAEGASSINGTPTNGNLGIWPNPASEHVQVALPFPATGTLRLEVIDATGRTAEVRSVAGMASEITLNVRTLAPGVWTVRITGPEHAWTGRFMRVAR